MNVDIDRKVKISAMYCARSDLVRGHIREWQVPMLTECMDGRSLARIEPHFERECDGRSWM